MYGTTGDFQQKVRKLLVRNKSLLDILTKFHITNGRVNRSTIKAATACGCIKINARKSTDIFKSNGNETQIEGELCEDCKNAIKREIGENIFYLASLCNALDIDLDEILLEEISRVDALGKYNLR